jgi:PAT family beta-lactamase induction signal transducer AmpG
MVISYNKYIKSLIIYSNPIILKIWFFGLSSGLTLLLSGNTLNFWMAKEGLDKITIGLFSLVALPYVCKFLLAPIIDLVKIPYLSHLLGQRKAWILVSQISIIIFVILLSFTDPKIQLLYTAIFSFCIALSSVTQDIALDGFRVEILQNQYKAPGSAMYIFGYRIGMFIYYYL